MDRIDSVRRSALMARVRSKDTVPELVVRYTLHALGYRFRLHVRDLPGSPDLVFPRRRKVLFVDGCFWHGHHCRLGRARPKSRLDYWEPKLAANKRRDARVRRRLRAEGWSVGVVWECQTRTQTWLNRTLRFLSASKDLDGCPSRRTSLFAAEDQSRETTQGRTSRRITCADGHRTCPRSART